MKTADDIKRSWLERPRRVALRRRRWWIEAPILSLLGFAAMWYIVNHAATRRKGPPPSRIERVSVYVTKVVDKDGKIRAFPSHLEEQWKAAAGGEFGDRSGPTPTLYDVEVWVEKETFWDGAPARGAHPAVSGHPVEDRHVRVEVSGWTGDEPATRSVLHSWPRADSRQGLWESQTIPDGTAMRILAVAAPDVQEQSGDAALARDVAAGGSLSRVVGTWPIMGMRLVALGLLLGPGVTLKVRQADGTAARDRLEGIRGARAQREAAGARQDDRSGGSVA